MAEVTVSKNNLSYRGFNKTFGGSRLSLGLFMPIESYAGDTPTMTDQDQLAVEAEWLGFSTLWFRDVPLRVPNFGDVGQIYDPITYMGWIGAKTSEIALATGALVLPIRHPLHTAKSVASLDNLTGGRFILGASSGDRAEEYPAFGANMATRGAAFRDNLDWIKKAWSGRFPKLKSEFYGDLIGSADPIPKPLSGNVPTMIVGGSQQDIHWVAEHGDAWIMYPRPLQIQSQVIKAWHDAQKAVGVDECKPFGQSLYVDLVANPDEPPRPIHLGFRAGRNYLIQHLEQLEELGVKHVILNLKYGSRPAIEVIQEIGAHVLPTFAEQK